MVALGGRAERGLTPARLTASTFFFFVLNEEDPSERLPMRPLTLDLRTDPTDGVPTYDFTNIQTFLTNYRVNQIMRFA